MAKTHGLCRYAALTIGTPVLFSFGRTRQRARHRGKNRADPERDHLGDQAARRRFAGNKWKPR